MIPATHFHLKQPTGWFAAGCEIEHALILLSGVAFKLFVWLCLHAKRSRGSLSASPAALASALHKTEPEMRAALDELFQLSVCSADWFSRYVLSWQESVHIESSFCVAALDWALKKATPVIFNSDQGAPFTSQEFTNRLLDHRIAISMDAVEVELWTTCSSNACGARSNTRTFI